MYLSQHAAASGVLKIKVAYSYGRSAAPRGIAARARCAPRQLLLRGISARQHAHDRDSARATDVGTPRLLEDCDTHSDLLFIGATTETTTCSSQPSPGRLNDDLDRALVLRALSAPLSEYITSRSQSPIFE